MEEVIKNFLAISSGYGYGSGDGSGDGYGYGYGSGDGSGDGYGSGSGSGDGSGYGYGSGYGSGYGYGYGSGYGDGSGYGYGYGYGSGYGSGSGYGDGVKSYNGLMIYLIDNVQTLIYSVRGNIAKGAVLNSDLTLTDCYIAKYGNCFAHGETAHKAMQDAISKAMKDMPVEDRIKDVTSKYKDIDTPIEHSELFSLHNMLTGSCLMGRKQFACEHNLDPEHGTMTMRAFIELTKDAYGGDVIRHLAEAYKAMEE